MNKNAIHPELRPGHSHPKSRLLATAIILSASLSAIPALSHAAAIVGQGTWETTLQGRNLDGNPATYEAWYDTALDITWLADANYAQTAGFDANGQMNWTTANNWATALNPYGSGITGWRLPTVTDVGNNGCQLFYGGGTDCGYSVNTATGEMAHMFYTTLGNLAYCDPATSRVTCAGIQPGWGLTNTGPFANVQSYDYWSATGYAPNTNYAWYFDFGHGDQGYSSKPSGYHAWAVHSGDVGAATVPVPPALSLLGGGLLGLGGFRRKRRR